MMEKMSKYRVDDDWINCEMAYLKKRMKFDDSDAALTTETSVPILFAMLEEIKARREIDTSGGVTMERVSDEWISRTLAIAEENCGKYGTVEVLGRVLVKVLNELQARREAERSADNGKVDGHTDNSANEKDGAGATQEKPVLPIPCTKGFEAWTVKDYFQKINEELDELKDAMLMSVGLGWRPDSDGFKGDGADVRSISDEAADTITAITSMLDAMGIDERQRQAAQRRVNDQNERRGRI